MAYLLVNLTSAIHPKLKQVFSSFINPVEALRKKRFIGLHYSVFGLSTLDPEQQLMVSRADIESKCSMGRTPLLWAASICNMEAIKTLLKLGADMQSCDIYGQSVLHRAASVSAGAGPQTLRILIESYLERATVATEYNSAPGSEAPNSLKTFLDYQEFEGYTPLLFTAINDFAKQTKLLLSYGAETGIPSGCRSQPLLQAVETNSHSALGILL